MVIKKRENVTNAEIENLANELADKPYGDEKNTTEDPLVRTSLTLPKSMLFQLEDTALKNKRTGNDLKSVSAIVRAAVEQFIK